MKTEYRHERMESREIDVKCAELVNHKIVRTKAECKYTKKVYSLRSESI